VRGLLVISPGDVEHEFVPVETGEARRRTETVGDSRH
jgi:hypothetical protein